MSASSQVAHIWRTLCSGLQPLYRRLLLFTLLPHPSSGFAPFDCPQGPSGQVGPYNVGSRAACAGEFYFIRYVCASLYATSYYDEERQSQRLKLKGDKEVAQEQLDKLVAGQLRV